jgi:chromosome segregation ATPase
MSDNSPKGPMLQEIAMLRAQLTAKEQELAKEQDYWRGEFSRVSALANSTQQECERLRGELARTDDALSEEQAKCERLREAGYMVGGEYGGLEGRAAFDEWVKALATGGGHDPGPS